MAYLTPVTINLLNLVPVNGNMIQYSLVVSGILGNKINAAVPAPVMASGVASVVRADVIGPSIGNDILIGVYQSGTLWASLDIPAGSKSVVLGSGALAALAAVVFNDLWTVNITQVGGIFPGSDLTVTIVV